MTNLTSSTLNYFYRTGPVACPYISGQVERNLFTEIKGSKAQALYDHFARAGFRRSHNILYRPACPDCRACVPVRVNVGEFCPSKSQRRVLRMNQNLLIREIGTTATLEQHALFTRYQYSRHGDSDMAAMNMADYRAMIEESPIDTRMIELRTPQGRLVACCLVDFLGDGLSAVYSFYSPMDVRRSLGTHMILWLIGRARKLNLPFVYLGYWISKSEKMSYKTRFGALQELRATGWTHVESSASSDIAHRSGPVG